MSTEKAMDGGAAVAAQEAEYKVRPQSYQHPSGAKALMDTFVALAISLAITAAAAWISFGLRHH